MGLDVFHKVIMTTAATTLVINDLRLLSPHFKLYAIFESGQIFFMSFGKWFMIEYGKLCSAMNSDSSSSYFTYNYTICMIYLE